MFTPNKQRNSQPIFGTPLNVPSSPMAYGTGVEVFRFNRPPDASGSTRSPWAIKCVAQRRGVNSLNFVSTRLRQEADILRSLDHPNIVGFRGLRKLKDGREVLVMEECTISLGDLLEERYDAKSGPLPAFQMKKICQDMCEALDYLHNTAHLLHGDIKSFNVLIKNDFEICKLCDFGVSLPLNSDGYVDLVKKPDAQYIGTSIWSAPEALKKDNIESISSKADIFSLGLVMYECIACVPPHMYGRETDSEKDELGQNDEKESFNTEASSDSYGIENDNENDELGQKEEDEEEDTEDSDEENEFESVQGTRPPLPFVDSLGDEYNGLVEIFFICTNTCPDERPTAKSLAGALKKI